MRGAAAIATLLLASLAAAQPYDPALSFRTLETPHFLVYFHQGEDELAQRTARLAERAHELLCPLAGHEPAEPTHIVLVDIDDAANGYATPLPRNTIQLLAAAPDPRSELNAFEDWTWQLLVHEYTHILHLDNISGISWLGNAVLGKQFSPNMLWPRWFIEGWAVVQESRLSRAGRVKSSLQEMQVRMQVLEGAPLTLANLSSPPLAWPRRSAWYLYGGYFLDFIREHHGDAALARMSADNGGSWIPYLLGWIAKEHTGSTFAALYDGWIASLRTRFEADARALGPTSPEARWTTTGERRVTPRPSPDGRTIYSILRDGDDRARLVAFDLERHTERVVTRLNDVGSLTVLPDGRVLLSQTDVFRQFQRYEDLFLVDPVTGDTEKVTEGARLSEPDAGADGSIVAVQRLGPGRTAIVRFESLASLRTGPGRILFEGSDLHPVASPRNSPDGRSVVHAVHRGEAYDLQLLDVATGATRALTTDTAQDLEPAFTPDGTRILFSADRTGIYDVYELELASGAVSRRTRVLGGAFEPFEKAGRLHYLRFGANGYDLAIQPEPWREDAPIAREPRGGPRAPSTVGGDPFPARDYRLRTLAPTWWFPVVGKDPLGWSLGASLGGNDVLDRFTWRASGFWSVAGQEAGYSASLRTDALRPYVTLSSSRSLGLAAGSNPGYVERTTTARALAGWSFQRPLSSTRIEAGYQASWLQMAVRGRVDPTGATPPQQGRLTAATLNITHSSALRFDRSISPEEGRRITLELRGAHRLLGSEFELATATASWAEYLRLPWSLHHVLALRLGGGAGVGELGKRRLFSLGGPGLSTLLDDALSLQSPTKLLRGSGPGTFAGSAWWLASAEYRFPIAAPEFGYGTLPLGLRRVHGAAFIDAGRAFDPPALGLAAVGAGVELRCELTLGYQYTTDLRIGYARGLTGNGGDHLLLLVGSGF